MDTTFFHLVIVFVKDITPFAVVFDAVRCEDYAGQDKFLPFTKVINRRIHNHKYLYGVLWRPTDTHIFNDAER